MQAKVISQMQERPKLIAMDTMNFCIGYCFRAIKECSKNGRFIGGQRRGSSPINERDLLVKAATKIRKMGPKFLIIKKGEHGALLFHGNRVFFAPALPLEDVFDIQQALAILLPVDLWVILQNKRFIF